MCLRLTTLLLVTSMATAMLAQKVVPIPYAHAHNDYAHQRPLLDALAHGFTSIEVDVFAIDGELYVYHDLPSEPAPERTLKNLYLEPLRVRMEQNRGLVYPAYQGHFQLMIDIKSEAEPTYRLIREQLAEYTSMFSRVEAGEEVAGAIMVFLSGNRPIATIMNADSHIARLDGRPDDLGKGYPAAKMPVISERYGKLLHWAGTGKMPRSERRQLRDLCKKVHKEGKRLRLWAIPGKEKAWSTFLRQGMDWINADDLAGLQSFHAKN